MKIKLLLVLLVAQFSFSQERSCATTEKMEELSNNPRMKAIYENHKRLFESEFERVSNENLNGAHRRATLRIPVAVHFPSASATLTESEKQCLRNLAQNQVDILNADFNAANSDLSIWTGNTGAFFPGVNTGALDVSFEIANGNHPASTGLANGALAITFRQAFGGGPNGDWDPDWTGYLNLVVKNLSGGTLGYAYLGSSPADGAAVFINSSAFGSGAGCTGFVPGAPYNLGRTLTHELGHYLNLNHIWGDATCGNDGVSDTPQHNTSNGGCPAISHLSTCSGTPRELTMNYMDYTNDSCMYMLTQGQATRMQAHLNVIASSFNQDTLLSNGDFDKNSFVVYPNPNKGYFNIQFSEMVNEYTVHIIDQSGRTVFENKYSGNNSLNQEMNLNATAAGVYFITIKSDDFITTKKVLVQ
ncbi:MAG: hypothetical protein A2X07_10640 [Flavobacteria bacterium GWF1_32_7]|nr:MAG: hypothetical protein A2X07_10640 [Flavobacteria bacterium GWF1_32_7]